MMLPLILSEPGGGGGGHIVLWGIFRQISQERLKLRTWNFLAIYTTNLQNKNLFSTVSAHPWLP